MKLDLDNSNVKEVEVTTKQVRDYFNGADDDDQLIVKMDTWLDEAQGAVFTDQEKEYYLVIKVVP